jgi:hypothetical protein
MFDVTLNLLVLKYEEGNFLFIQNSLLGGEDGENNLLVDPEDIKSLNSVQSLNVEADSIYELHKEPSPEMEPHSIWNDFVLSHSR